MAELLVEFFSEEIPARMQLRAAEDLKTLAAKFLGEAGFTNAALESYVTPRRLVLVAPNLSVQQPDRSEEIKGPRIDAPEQAIKGFMQANGLKNLDGVEKREVGKGTHYFLVRHEKGKKTAEILPELIGQIIQQFPWPKSMKWGTGTQVWVRPLHAVNVIFDGKSIDRHPGEGRDPKFIGHRFLSPKPFKATSFAQYKSELLKHHVVLDQTERRAEIQKQIEKIATAQKLATKLDDALLDEVTGLVEWPTAMLGEFEKEYLAVPQECLIATMRANQKYFPLFDVAGKLANHFILIANVPGSTGPAPITHGNGRVLRARLSDAKFFYEQDLKTPLASRVEKLKAIQFHEKLGTVYEKTQRAMKLAEKLAAALKADVAKSRRAVELSKADLVTGMVGEFPELQGIMGRYYAIAGGEDTAVADAVRDHYQPLGPAADVPTAPISIVAALADKLDTLNEFFRINEKPTGSKDPYALRRAALGVIRIILENNIRLPLSEFARADVLDFIKDRLKFYLKDQNLPNDICAAVLTTSDDLFLTRAKAFALQQLITSQDGKNLLALTKRASNILKIEEKKDDKSYKGVVKTDLFRSGEEETLFQVLAKLEIQVAEDIKKEEYVWAAHFLLFAFILDQLRK